MKYLIGGAFDPITHAHEAIIKAVYKKLRKGNTRSKNGDVWNDKFDSPDSLYILVSNTDEKNYKTPVNERVAMVNVAMAARNMRPNIQIQDLRTYEYITREFGSNDKDITIVIGEDEWKALVDGKWKFGKQLLNNYQFLVVPRSNSNGVIPGKYAEYENMKVLLGVNTEGISSSEARKIFYRNPECHYKDVKQYISKPVFEYIRKEGELTDDRDMPIKSNSLYDQNPTNYAELEKQWIENYKKQGWGKFANTVDIVGISGEEVLLIRRKKPPYMNYFCTPGGFFNPVDYINKETKLPEKADASLEHAAQREFREETSLDLPVEKFIQIKTYSHMFDPRLRIIDTAVSVKVTGKEKKLAKAGDDAKDAAWFNINELPKMGFHHEKIIEDYLNK